MTYVKQEWDDNDPSKVLSAARMTHIEDGIEAVEASIPATPPSDPAAGTPGLRTLGTGAQQAMPGNTAIVAASDIQRLAYLGLQAGVFAAGDLMVTQKGSGANLSVDVAAGYALVASASSGLLVPVSVASTQNLPVVASSAQNRVVQVIIDTAGTVSLLQGSEQSGATLDNAAGTTSRAALPAGSLRLGEFVVGTATASISNSFIRDRRPWARGAYYPLTRTSGSYTTTSGSAVELDSTNVKPRFECSGVPVCIRASGTLTNTGANSVVVAPALDGALISSMEPFSFTVPVTGSPGIPFSLEWVTTPSAGSHRFSVLWRTGGGTATIFATSSIPFQFEVEELVRQASVNNGTTSG